MYMNADSSLLLTLHGYVFRAGLRTETSIVAESAQCFSTHHMAMLIGYGAHAVCPYLALETCRQWRKTPRWVSPEGYGCCCLTSSDIAVLFRQLI